ncbi:MAG: DNA-directed RNA polymerase subunit alpha [Candidatus Saccharibacteria bacterium]|nr:DNA-directed RNA polymerase subunit alpha [Candidatus Saccharibacteria bacterium]
MAKNIYNPTLKEVINHSDNSATIVISPVNKGYGNTLGNSLRRVLLSSIRGGAVVAAKIHGATHEFTTVKGVKEDIVDIMLNLKNIHLIIHSDAPIELSLKKNGAGPVYASDIKVTSDVEIVNPTQIIATIDDPKASLEIDLVVEAGRGYKNIDIASKERLHSDMIALDAFFSPVLRVRYKVSDTRVGQETNLEKLEITIDTDGSLSPSQAFEEAAAILVNQYQSLAGATVVEPGEEIGRIDNEASSELNSTIEDLNLSARTTNALINNDIRTVDDLLNLSEQDLQELKGFGQKALDEVKSKLAELEL